MYKHILIATDGSQLGDHAVVHGLALAKEVKARVTVVTVTQLWSAMEMAQKSLEHNYKAVQQFEEMEAASAKKILAAAADKAKAAGVNCEVVHVPDQHPAEGIIATAESKGCDLIVMASHGRRAIGRLLLGSQVSEVLAHSKVPALVVR